MTVQGRLGGNKVYQAFISFGMAVIHQPITLYCPNQARKGLLALTLPILYIYTFIYGCIFFHVSVTLATQGSPLVKCPLCPALYDHFILFPFLPRQQFVQTVYYVSSHPARKPGSDFDLQSHARDKHKTGFAFLHYFAHLTSHCEVQPILYILFFFLPPLSLPPSPVLSLPGWSLACGAPFSQLQQQWCWALFNPIISGSQIPMVPGTGVPALPSWLSSLVLFPLLHPELHFSPLMFALGGPNSQCSALEKVT